MLVALQETSSGDATNATVGLFTLQDLLETSHVSRVMETPGKGKLRPTRSKWSDQKASNSSSTGRTLILRLSAKHSA